MWVLAEQHESKPGKLMHCDTFVTGPRDPPGPG